MIKEDRLVQMIADAALDGKALDVVILDVRDLTVISDYFVIAGGRSVVQVKSIADMVEEKLAQYDIQPIRREGHEEGKWVVLDYNSTMLHVFRQEEREHYALENLWGEARHVEVEDSL
ncbi:MAG: ribosome silencing factor [Syntrophomonas sp.]